MTKGDLLAQSAEHKLVAESFGEVLQDFAALDLYALTDIERQRYDFGCTVVRDWSRVLIGQTLWRHTSGTVKDVQSLLFDRSAEIKVCLVREHAATVRRYDEVVAEFRQSERFDDQLARLVTIPVPLFDADKEDERGALEAALRDRVVENLLLRVVFGGLTAGDVAYFSHTQSNRGFDVSLNLRLLHYLRANDFISNRGTALAVGTTAAKVRERLHVLYGARFIRPHRHSFVITARGRTLLDLIDRMVAESHTGALSPQLVYLLTRVGLGLEDLDYRYDPDAEQALAVRPIQWVIGSLAHQFAPEWRFDLDGFLAGARAATGHGEDWPWLTR